MKLLKFLACLLPITLVVGKCLNPPVVQDLDVGVYANNQSWYEITRTKTEVFEQDLVCVHAKYTPKPDGHLAVFNEGRRGSPSGKRFSIVGDAYAKDPTVPAKLTVKFPVTPWEAPYWIVYLDEGYQHAVVYTCQILNFGWILSRTPLVDPDSLNRLLNIADSLGLHREDFVPILQSGC